MNGGLFIVILIVVVGIGVLCGYLLRYVVAQRKMNEAEDQSRRILHEAEKEAENKVREAAQEAQESWQRTQARFVQETDASRLELRRLEEKVAQREVKLEQKIADTEQKEHQLQSRDHRLQQQEEAYGQKENELAGLFDTQMRKLEQIAKMKASKA
ncbi:MAG: Rnase Y domain-containing protein, partial [Candidatus Tectomicrobia bacterium]